MPKGGGCVRIIGVMSAAPIAETFPPFEQYADLIKLAVREDLGDLGDVTSRLTIDESAIGVGTIVQKGAGVACGLPAIEPICRLFDERLRLEWIPGLHLELVEGRFTEASGGAPTPLVRVRGPVRALLAAERTLLNVLGHLSGVATLTRKFARRLEGTGATIYDTRKTLPGWRALEKYAVRCGGGANHRFGLYDMVLVKDNHLAGGANGDLSTAVADLVRRSRAEDAGRPIEVEVDTLAQFRKVLAVPGVDIILLDNMDCPTMSRCVQLRNESPNRPILEASGGVTLETVRDIAQTGVERIAVGAVTHSAVNLDVGLDLEPA